MIKINISIEEQADGIAVAHSTPPSENSTLLESMMYHRLKVALDTILALSGGTSIDVTVPEEMKINPARN
jgi:hypothetical protein